MTRTTHTRTPNVALASAVALAIAFGLACDGSITITGPNSGKAHACDVTYDKNWPTSGKVYVDQPTKCPFHLFGPQYISYGATAKLKRGTYAPFLNTEFYNALNHRIQAAFTQTSWSYSSGVGSDTLDAVQINGQYYAATAWQEVGGFDPGADNAVHELRLMSGDSAAATVKLEYAEGEPDLEINVPPDPPPYSRYTLASSVHNPQLIPPLNYSWTVRGAVVSTDTSVTWTAGAGGTWTSFTLTVTDAYGTRYSNVRSVMAARNCQTQGC